MSVEPLKYMAGLYESVAGGENDANYDPHQHRKIEKPTSYADSMIHLLKGSIGAGILAMPEATHRVGIWFATFGLLGIGIFATYCIELLIYVQYMLCKRWKKGYMAYPKSMKLALQDGPPCMRWSGKFFYYFVDTVLVIWQLGLGTVYFLFIAENISQVLSANGINMSIRELLYCIIVPMIIPNLVKDLKMMTPLSAISNVVTIMGLLLVFFYLVEDDILFESYKLQIKSFEGVPVYIGTALFALEAVGVVLAVEYNMEKPKEFLGLFGLFSLSMAIVITLYMLVGTFGYAKYGEKIKAVLTLNLPNHEKKAMVAKSIFAVAIFLSFPLQNFPAYKIIWLKLRKRIPENKRCVPDYALRVILVILPWLLAVAVPTLGPFISLFGAFCLSLLAVIFPGLMDICLWYKEPSGYGTLKWKLIRDVFIVIVGTFCLISGCYTSVVDIIKEF